MRSYKSAEARRTEILSAALELFSRNGYQGTTMESIAASIHIARTTLYEYYNSKEDILYALVDAVVEAERERPLEGPIQGQLKILAEEAMVRLKENFTLYRILFKELPALSASTAKKLGAWQNRSMMAVLEVLSAGEAKGAFRPHLKVEDVAFAFRALIGQRMADLLLAEGEVQPGAEAKRLVDLLWCGVGQTTDFKEEWHD